jgi:hypothetical protein
MCDLYQQFHFVFIFSLSLIDIYFLEINFFIGLYDISLTKK